MKKSSIFLFIVSIVTLMIIGVSGAYALGIDHQGFKGKEQCLNCHSQWGFNVETFESSVHEVFECTSCHQFNDDGSKEVNCTNCHTGAGFEYERSVHGKSSAGPTCIDCHGNAHEIVHSTNPTSHVYGANLTETCGDCHEEVSHQYKEGFHGKAVALGSKNAPDCTTCHGSHSIWESENSLALTSAGRKSELCAECHAGNSLGVGAPVHYELEPTGYGKPMYYIKTKMPWLILIVMGIFLVLIESDLLHRLRNRT